jgi:hypothetical protein
MSQRARSKGLQNTEKILGAGLPVKEYAIGVIGPDPRGTVAILILAFAAVVAVTVLFFGLIVIPGFLLLGAIFGAIDRPASFAVTERGLVVLARSEVNGRPRKLLTVLPQSVLASPTVKRSGGYVQICTSGCVGRTTSDWSAWPGITRRRVSGRRRFPPESAQGPRRAPPPLVLHPLRAPLPLPPRPAQAPSPRCSPTAKLMSCTAVGAGKRGR